MSTQPSLFDPAPVPRFDGPDVTPQDTERLTCQLWRVRKLLSDGKWRTLREIADGIGMVASEAGLSARLRDLRKERFGGHTVERRRLSGGVWEYRLIARSK